MARNKGGIAAIERAYKILEQLRKNTDKDHTMSEEIIVDLPEEESGTRYFCFFKCNESKECENVILNSLEFVVSKDSPKESDIMFCTLKPNITGLSLPQNIKQVNDNSAVNLKPCRYSGLNGQCLHPYITRIIKEAICKKNDKKPEDYILLGALFASETLSQDAVRFYLNDKGSDVDMIIEKIGKKTENALQEVDIKEGHSEGPKLTIL